MQKINELENNIRTEEIIKELDEICASLKANGIEVRKAIEVLEAEIKEKQTDS